MCQVATFIDQHPLVPVLFGFVAEDKSAGLLDLPNNVRNEIVSGIVNVFQDLIHKFGIEYPSLLTLRLSIPGSRGTNAIVYLCHTQVLRIQCISCR